MKYFIKFNLVILISFVFVSCSNNRGFEIEKYYNNFLRNKNKFPYEIRFDTISSFDWDKLLIIGPYRDINSEEFIAYDLQGVSDEIKHHDNFILFVFLNQKKGVRYIELDSDETLFKNLKDGEYKKEDSRFKIMRFPTR